MKCEICGKEIEKSSYSNAILCSSECFGKHFWNEIVKDKNNRIIINGNCYVDGGNKPNAICGEPPGRSLGDLPLPRHGGHRRLLAGAECVVRDERRLGGISGKRGTDGSADGGSAVEKEKNMTKLLQNV